MFSDISTPSQLVERNLSLFSGDSLIVAGSLEDNFAATLATHSNNVQLHCHDYRLYCHYKKSPQQNLQISFGETFSGSVADILLIYMPKSKEEARFLLAKLCPFLSQTGEIFIIGENRGGINSAPKLLQDYANRAVKVDSARRCSLFRAPLSKPVAPFNIVHWYKEFTVTVQNQSFIVMSLPGVFSHGKLDQATQLLLEQLMTKNHRFSGRLLDFGCGAGVIATFIKKNNPDTQVELVDINALALASSRETFKANQIDGKVYASNIYSDINGRFNHIISNPPFHAGLNTHYHSTEIFLEKSGNYLSNKGELTIVANSFLKYQAFIDKALPQCEILFANNKFKIYYAKR